MAVGRPRARAGSSVFGEGGLTWEQLCIASRVAYLSSRSSGFGEGGLAALGRRRDGVGSGIGAQARRGRVGPLRRRSLLPPAHAARVSSLASPRPPCPRPLPSPRRRRRASTCRSSAARRVCARVRACVCVCVCVRVRACLQENESLYMPLNMLSRDPSKRYTGASGLQFSSDQAPPPTHTHARQNTHTIHTNTHAHQHTHQHTDNTRAHAQKHKSTSPCLRAGECGSSRPGGGVGERGRMAAA